MSSGSGALCLPLPPGLGPVALAAVTCTSMSASSLRLHSCSLELQGWPAPNTRPQQQGLRKGGTEKTVFVRACSRARCPHMPFWAFIAQDCAGQLPICYLPRASWQWLRKRMPREAGGLPRVPQLVGGGARTGEGGRASLRGATLPTPALLAKAAAATLWCL